MAPPSLSFSNIRKTLDPNRQICWSLSIFKEWIIKIMIFFVFLQQIWLNYDTKNVYFHCLYNSFTKIDLNVKISQHATKYVLRF